MTTDKENRIEKAIKGKGCLTQIIILIFIFIFGWYAYRHFTSQNPQQDALLNELFPQQASEEITITDWLAFNSTTGTDLSLKYSPSWEVSSETVGRDEFTTFRSPTDDNGFYFCLNLKGYYPDSTVNLEMTANVLLAEDFTTEGIGKPLKRIVYQSPELGDLHLSLTDDLSVTESQGINYKEQIVNPFAWRLMIQARYNCFDENPPQLGLNEFENSQSVQETLRSLRTLRY